MDTQRYTAVAIVLHWAIALMLLALIPMGWWMADAIAGDDPAVRNQAAAVFQLHKSLGLSVLVLSLARLAWRFAHRPPPAPPMPAWQAAGLKATHFAFYALMIALPISGLAYASTGWSAEQGRALNVPTIWFGLFEVPKIGPIASQPESARIAIAETTMSAHSAMAWGVIVLTALHVAAALKHQFLDRDGILGRMVPGLAAQGAAPAGSGRSAALAVGFGLIALAAGAVALTFPQPQRASAEAALSAPAAESVAAPVAAEAAPEEAAPTTPPAPAETAATEAAPKETAAAETAPPPPQAAAAPPPAWTVDAGASAIRFKGTHAGVAFEGRFKRWSADIRFDPANLSASKAVVTIETGSADAGDPARNSSLQEAEWFNPKAHPTARFETTRITAKGGDRYLAEGRLTIKGKSRPAAMPFTLTIADGRATMTGALTLDRTALDLGMSSDPAGEWVSKEIPVEVAVTAARTP